MKIKRIQDDFYKTFFIKVFELIDASNVIHYGISATYFWHEFIDKEYLPFVNLMAKLQNYKNTQPDKFIYWQVKNEYNNDALIVSTNSVPLFLEYAAAEGYPLAKSFWRKLREENWTEIVQKILAPKEE